jgi:AcrR family transcriptional regulator
MSKTAPERRKESLFRQIAPSELKKGELRKLEIVEAAIDCLSRYGWIRTNYETVGQACNMKRPHVAYHFPQWDNLISASLKYVYATGQAIVSDYLREAEGPKDQLQAYIEGTFHWLHSHPKHAAAVSLLWHLASFDKKYRKISTEMKKVGVDRLDAILNPTGALDKKRDRWKTSLSIHGLIVGRCVEVLSADMGLTESQVVEQTLESAWRLHTRK